MARIALKQRAREAWQKLSRLDATPDQIAAGFSIGIFAGFVPLNPSPEITAIVVAWLLKRNVIAAMVGAAASILYLPLLPLIWLAEYQLGKLILPVRHPMTLDPARLWDLLQNGLWDLLQNGWDVYAAMLVGSLIIATPVTLLAYLVIKRLAVRWARKNEVSQVV